MAIHPKIIAHIDHPFTEIFGPLPPHKNSRDPIAAAFYSYLREKIISKKWHWLRSHFFNHQPEKNIHIIANYLAAIELKSAGTGFALAESLCKLNEGKKNERAYEGMMQVFAEIYVLYKIVRMPWSAQATFTYEPKGGNGKRPEMKVESDGKQYLFEVKCPSLLSHQRLRGRVGTQVPTRKQPGVIEALTAKGEHIIAPRDMPIKDFLISADEKFSGFPRGEGANFLVIVWDDFIYEPIGSLIDPHCGLLTENSFYKVDGRAVTYENIDAIFCLRNLSIFKSDIGDMGNPYGCRHIFDDQGENFPSGVYFDLPHSRDFPKWIGENLHATRYEAEKFSGIAEYHPQDYVLWINPRGAQND